MNESNLYNFVCPHSLTMQKIEKLLKEEIEVELLEKKTVINNIIYMKAYILITDLSLICF